MNSHATPSVISRILSILTTRVAGIGEALAAASPAAAFGRGLRWAITLTAGLTVVSGLVASLLKLASASVGFRYGMLSALSAAGSDFNYSVDLMDGDSVQTFYLDVAQRISMLTVIVLYTSWRLGRREARRGVAAPVVAAGALWTGIGFGGTMWLASHLVTGNLILGASLVHVAPSTFVDGLTMAAVASVPAMLAGYAHASSPSRSPWFTVAQWAGRSLRFFAYLYLALMLFSAVVLAVFYVIRPHFAVSPGNDGGSTNVPWKTVGVALVSLALVLPALVIMVLAVATGSGLGLLVGAPTGSGFAAAVNSYLPIDQIATYLESVGIPMGGGGDFFHISIGDTAGPIALIVVSVVVGLVAFIVGGLATRRATTMDSSALGTTVGALSVLLACAWWLAHTGVTATNKGFMPHEIAAGQLPLNGLYASIGISLSGLLATGTYVGLCLWLGSRVGGGGMAYAFPVLARTMRTPMPSSGSREGWRGFGMIVKVVVFALAASTISLGVVERRWASADAPAGVVADLVAKLTSGDLAKAKGLATGSQDYSWLADDALKAALPSATDVGETSIMNSHGNDYSLGQLDPVATVTFTRDDQSAIVPVEIQSNVRAVWKVLRRATFRATYAANTLSLTGSKDLVDALRKSIKVNDVAAELGTYNVVPGFYHVTAAGDRLIAATDTWVTFEDGQASVPIGTTLNLSDTAKAQLSSLVDARSKACSTSASVARGTCYPKVTLAASAVLKSGEVLQGANKVTVGAYTVTGTTCDLDAPMDMVVSPVDGNRAWSCEQTVTYDVTYKTNPVYRIEGRVTRSETYDACPDCDDYVWRTRIIVVNPGRRVLVSYGKTSKASFEAKVNFVIRARVQLKGKDTYIVKLK